MVDVATTAINGNPVKNGDAVVSVRNSNLKVLSPTNNKGQTIAVMETKLTNRFDDPKYYTA